MKALAAFIDLVPRWLLLVLLGAVVVLLGAQRVQVSNARTDAATARGDLDRYRTDQAEAARTAERSARTKETEWRTAMEKEARDGQTRINLALGDAARARAALDGLRRQLAAVASTDSPAATGAEPADTGPATSATGDVLADMLGGGGAALVELAQFADAAHAAGVTCERSAAALRPEK